MLTQSHFLTQEGLSDLLSVATFGNYWPVIKIKRSEYHLAEEYKNECLEDKWAAILINGGTLLVNDYSDCDNELYEDDNPTQHELTLKGVRKGLETLADTLESEFVLGGVVIFVEFVVAVGVVIDQQSTTIDEDSRPLVLKALVLVFFSEMIFATLDFDDRPVVAKGRNGKQVGKPLLGKEVRLSKHIVSF